MTRSQSLEAALLANVTIADLVGTRIYPLEAVKPDGQPTLIYRIVVAIEYTVQGQAMVKAAITLYSCAVDYDVAHQVADAVKSLLSPATTPKGFSGALGGTGGINVLRCRLETEEEDFINITADEGWFRVTSEYRMEYT